MVGGARLADRGRNQRRHIFRHAREGFSHRDYTYLQLAFGTIIGRILVSYIFIKPYYDYKVFSIYEYLTARVSGSRARTRLPRFS